MYVRFRSGPSTDSTILGEYNTGKELSVTGYSGDWTACVINDQTRLCVTASTSLLTSDSETPDSGSHTGASA